MARYHFNIEGDGFTDEGHDLANLAEAKCEAVKLAGRVICENADNFWDKGDWNMSVTNGDGLTLFTLTLYGAEAAACGTKLQRVGA
jgi:hypothetical protein